MYRYSLCSVILYRCYFKTEQDPSSFFSFKNKRPMPADDYAASAEEAHRPPARPVPGAEGAHRPPSRPVPVAEEAHRPPARPVPATEEAHRLPPARPGPAINSYEDHNGENNRWRAIPVESEDEDRDLQLSPPPKKKSTSEIAREAYEVYPASAKRDINLETKMEKCKDNFCLCNHSVCYISASYM